jgi:hypothetical protein
VLLALLTMVQMGRLIDLALTGFVMEVKVLLPGEVEGLLLELLAG